MAGRQSHGRQSHGRSLATGPKKAAAPNRRSKARAQATALDAYNIAAKQFPQKEKQTPRSRFMNPEDDEDEEEEVGANRRSRNRDDEDDEDDEDDDEDAGDRRPAQRRGRRDEDGSDVEYGSDESGNEWRINGRINADEDSELDSDEAFCESDEEMFSGYTFGGTKSKPRQKNSDSEEEYESDASSLGSDAVDLATALDMAEAESSEEEAHDGDSESGSGDDQSGSSSEESSDEDSDEESDDDVDGPSRQKVSLKELASEFAGFGDDDEDDAVATGKQKISLGDLGLIKTRDANIRKSVKLLTKEETDARSSSAKLAVPLAPLQQAQVTRKVAFEKTADTMDRWTETIKANRRADHLQFPLLQDTANASLSTKEFRPITVDNAANELEKTMLDLLAQSGMSLERPKKKPVDDQGNELTAEQIKELVNKRRKEREMRSREEKRAKRIKKIKSKAYHRIHRKQAQKDEMAMRAEMEANGELDSEAEREDAARKRALERVGARHRDSKWAKANSRTKRAVWDTDYREGIEDMARREIELKRRIDGKDSSSDEYDSDDSDGSAAQSGDDEVDEKTRLRRQLAKLKAERDDDGSLSQLNKMDFMQRVESQRAHENDSMIREIERMLASGDEEESDPENMIDGQVGRRAFGGVRASETQAADADAMDVDADSDAADERPRKMAKTTASSAPVAVSALVRKNDQRKAAGRAITEAEDDEVQFVLDNKGADLNTGEAWATAPRAKKPSRKSKVAASSRIVELDISGATATVLGSGSQDVALAPATPNKRAKKETKAVTDTGADTSSSDGSDSESDNDAIHHPLALRSERDLIARAFAGGDVVEAEFEAEKEAVVAEEDDKVIDNTLPGWGAWVGDGVSAREANKHKGKFTTTVAGVKRKDRRDTKLARVIVNEKRVKKNDRYLASQLPHMFETTDQYERSLRMPVGPEWMTKETFQASTKPKVLLKQGIIKPMSRPMK